MRRPMIAGNWKMNKTPAETVALLQELKKIQPHGNVEVVVAGAYELRIAVMSKESGVKTTGHFHADGQFHEGEDE